MSVSGVAIIIGRAGSKGLPGKNMLPIAGKACAQWTIEAAQSSERVGLVCLSSDDQRMLSLGEQMGTKIVRRPAALASDVATVDRAARHAIGELGDSCAHARTPIVLLYANVPVRPRGLIDRAIEKFVETGADSVQSYAPVGKYHPWWMARLDEDGNVRPWEGDVLNHGVFRRQDLPPAYVPDGGVMVVSRAALMLEIPGVAPGPHAFFGLKRGGVINREGEVVDIDSRVDLLVAEAMLNEQREAALGGSLNGGARA